jgi:hypothetical protein
VSDVDDWLSSDDEFEFDDVASDNWEYDVFVDRGPDWRDYPPEDDDGLGGVRELRQPITDPPVDAVELPEPGAADSSGH